jgi:hypothetical protein
MLFFRSEELARAWCTAREVPLRPLVRMDQLWTMATTWYATRLEPISRRPQASEMRGIFASIGLDDEFWDPGAEKFG